MAKDWIEYHCKSGETIFLYNKVTGEHKWPHEIGQGIEGKIMYGRPVDYKEFCTISTQTDDSGCSNGCMSMYINTHPSHVSNTSDNTMADLSKTACIDEEGCDAQRTNFGVAIEYVDNNNNGYDVYDNANRSEVDLDGGNSNDNLEDINQDANEDAEIRRAYLEKIEFSISTVGELDVKNNANGGRKEDQGSVDVTIVKKEIESTDDSQSNQKQVFECCYCKMKFSQDSEWSKHIRIMHFGGKPLKTSAQQTLNPHTQKNRFECSICRKVFFDNRLLHKHHLAHLGVHAKPFECSFCKETFSKKNELSAHLNTHRQGNSFKCSICEKEFVCYGSWRKHRLVHSQEKPFPCTVCNQRFTIKCNLKRHMLIHLDLKPFECKVCHKAFRQKSTLITHSQIHSGKKPYECPICKKKFTQRGSLKVHSSTHAKSFKCSVCNKKFTEESRLLEHINKHTECTKQFECSVCNMKFDDKNSLCKHANVHVSKDITECTICRRNFSSQTNLKRHMLIHLGVKPFECTICQKSFTQKSTLNAHFRTHSGAKQ